MISEFYRKVYLKTSGFIPLWPIGTEVEVGDILAFTNHRMSKLGNVYSDLQDTSLSKEYLDLPYPKVDWHVSKGVTMKYAKEEASEGREHHKWKKNRSGLTFRFLDQGSFFFDCEVSNVKKMKYWEGDFKKALIQRLTSVYFHFRPEIAIVTDVAEVKNLMAMVGASKGKLILANSKYFSNYPNDLKNVEEDLEIRYSKNLELIYLNKKERKLFFKAQKLVFREAVDTRRINDLYSNYRKELRAYIENFIDLDLLGAVPTDETYKHANEVYTFHPVTLDDVSIFLGEV